MKYYNIQKNNLQIIEVLEGEQREKRAEQLFKKIMTEKFPNLGRYFDIQVHKVCKSPTKSI